MPANMWVHDLPSPSGYAPQSGSLSSYLSPESAGDFSWTPIKAGLPQKACQASRVLDDATLAFHRPAFGGHCNAPGTHLTSAKPVDIPAVGGRHAREGFERQPHPKKPIWPVGGADKAQTKTIRPSSILSPEAPDRQLLGSWADRTVLHTLKPEQLPVRKSIKHGQGSYGFFPPGFVLQEPTLTAIWPEAKNAAKGPLEAAAAGAQAARPPRRVGFNAACRAVAPDTPQAARAGLKAQGGPCKPAGRARRDDGHLPLQERIWRMRARRAWIREQLQALRGFPEEDADYAEPWNDALALVEGMRGKEGAPTEFEARSPLFGDADVSSNDSALHDLLMFGEDEEGFTSDTELSLGVDLACRQPLTHDITNMNDQSPEGKTPCMENVVRGVIFDAGSPLGKAQQATPALQAVPKQADKGSAKPGNDLKDIRPHEVPQGIVAKAQELTRMQQSIEEEALSAWRRNAGNAEEALKMKAKGKAPSAMRQGLLREDSAYEVFPGYREVIKKAPADVGAALHKPAWAGALVPEVEIEQGDLTVIVVKLIDDRNGVSRLVQRGKAGMTGSAILRVLDGQLAQVARTHGLIKPKMQLIKAGRLHWSWDKGIEGKPAGAMAA